MRENREKQKKITFAECFYLGTRQSVYLDTLPSDKVKTLGKGTGFAECISLGTQQSWGLAECL